MLLLQQTDLRCLQAFDCVSLLVGVLRLASHKTASGLYRGCSFLDSALPSAAHGKHVLMDTAIYKQI